MDEAGAPGGAEVKRCLNCDAPLVGPYCSQCGQEAQELRVPFRRLVGDLLREVLDLDSRFAVTFRRLLLSPGFLTREYRAGRRVRYLSPFRLYLMTSVVFLFLVTSFGHGIRIAVRLPEGTAAEGPLSGGGFVQISGSTEFMGPLGPLVDRGLQVAREEPDRVRTNFFRAWSWTMFLLMPAFALLISLFFRGSGAYFGEHLILALHFHAYQFAILSVALLLGLIQGVLGVVAASLALGVFIPLYLLLALWRVYRQPLWKTVLKTALVGALYVLALGVLSGLVTLATLVAVA